MPGRGRPRKYDNEEERKAAAAARQRERRARQREENDETEEQRLDRRQRNGASQAKRRRNQTHDATIEEKTQNAEAHRLQREQETPDETLRRRSREAESQVLRRQHESHVETLERQARNAEAHRMQRQNETEDSRAIRQEKDRQIHKKRTVIIAENTRRILQQQARNVTEDETTIEEHYCGKMNVQCGKCGSLNFANERPSDGLFSQCCQKGKVVLPSQDYPELFELLMKGDHPLSDNFMQNIRSINSSHAFASFGANIAPPLGFGPYVFRVHGQIYHRTGTLYPEEGAARKFAQLYILDTSEATEERMKLKENEKCNENLMRQVAALLTDINPYVGSCKMMKQVEAEEEQRAAENNTEMPNIVMALKQDRNQDQRRYNKPRANEVAVVFQPGEDGDPPFDRDILMHLRPDPSKPLAPKLQVVKLWQSNLDALLYPIFYPRGEQGWSDQIPLKNVQQDAPQQEVLPQHLPANQEINQVPQQGSSAIALQDGEPQPGPSKTGKRVRVTQLQYYSYLLSDRNSFNPLLNGGKLTQQFFVDAYVKIEANRLNYIRLNQTQLRSEDYSAVHEHVLKKSAEKGIPIGRTVILPSSFEGSPRNMQQRYQDAMSIVAKYGRPDLFVTMTCNPKWKEISENLKPWQRVEHRPDLVARVFRLKLKNLLKEIKSGLFGSISALVHVIEFQKRGLPHAHILIILDNNSKFRTEEEIDNIVWAEIPNRDKYPELHKLVASHMIHGPCGSGNPKCPCMENGQCTKRFPKELRDHTLKEVDGYPIYRRLRGEDILHKNATINNTWVVPYNPYLLKRYNCHINVEICASIKSVKYLFKYVYKGHDQANVEIQEKTVTHDEPSQFVDSRYVSPPEAAWRIFAFPMHAQSHTIVRLAVHLPHQQQIFFYEDSRSENLEKAMSRTSTLLEWFKLNQNDEHARQFSYREIPEHYVWNDTSKIWTPRQRGAAKTIGRMYTVSLKEPELYFLRLLLLHRTGARGFDDLRTIDGEVHQTYKEAAGALGLLLDDEVWRNTIIDAVALQMPRQLRDMFAYICVFGQPTNAKTLWDEFKMDFTEDYCRQNHQNIAECTDCEARAMRDVEDILRLHDTSFTKFDLPRPAAHIPVDRVQEYNHEDEALLAAEMKETLNPAQRLAYNTIVGALENENATEPNCFFLDGPGGSGKTYLYDVLMHYVRGRERRVLPAATTGIAANLLKDGRTMHSYYGIPIRINETSVSNIKPGTIAARLLQDSWLPFIDECTLMRKQHLKVIDHVFRQVMTEDIRYKCQVPFGGKVFVLGGDFRQCLPVIPNGTRADIVDSCLKMSDLWPLFTRLSLFNNMRSLDPDYSRWLIKLGNGELTNEDNLGEDVIEIPYDMLATGCLVTEIFGENVMINVNDRESIKRAASNAILCPKNTDVDELNAKVMDRLPEEYHVYTSDDSIISQDEAEQQNFPVEFLNSLTPSGMPAHRLRLKTGAIIMLLRNLNSKKGLCNGTRLIVVALLPHLIQAKVITGSAEGDFVFIPRIDLCPSETGLPFQLKRRQFPVKPAFAMTINKSQGQTLNKVGIYLPEPVFGHGQLYVAFSRVKLRSNVKVQIIDTPQQGKLLEGSDKVYTRNIVYRNVL